MGTDTKRERPILFSGPMVRAIRDDLKTQTRRVMKLQPAFVPTSCHSLDCNVEPEKQRYGFWQGDRAWSCPYGGPGNGLWVREAWRLNAYGGSSDYIAICYRADGHVGKPISPGHGLIRNPPHFKWRPSIHMPRWASRIDLGVMEIRIERVQDISEEDAIAEGYPGTDVDGHHIPWSPRGWFEAVWETINARPKPLYQQKKIASYVSYPWGGESETREHRGLPWVVVPNPAVWVVTFRRKELPSQ